MKQGDRSLVRLARLAGIVAVAGMLATGTMAQTPSPATAAAPETEAPPIQPIPLEEVPDRAEATGAELEGLLPGETSGQTLERISSELDSTLEAVESLLTKTHEALAAQPSALTLSNLDAEFSDMLQRLQPWNEELASQLARVRAALQRTEAIKATWEATAEVARQEGAAEATVSRIAALRKRSDEARTLIIERRTRILAVRDRLVDPNSSLAANLKYVQDAAQKQLEGIFHIDRPPLWSPEVRESLREEWKAGALQAFLQRLEQTGQYMLGNRRKLGFQFALFVVLLLALYGLRRRARTWAEDDYNLRDAQQVFERPWAMAVLMAVLLTVPIHPLASHGIAFVAAVIGGLAATRIGRRLLSPIMAPLAWGLMILFVVDRAREMLDTAPTLLRVVFLVEMVATVAWLVWLLQPSRLAKVPEARRRLLFVRMVLAVLRLSVAFLALAIFSDVVGWGDLARLLGNTVLRSGYLGFFIFVLFMVVQSLAAFALVHRPLRLLRAITHHRQLVRRRIEWVLGLLAVGLWGIVLLGRSGLFGPVQAGIRRALDAGVSVGTLSISAGDVLAFALTVWLSFLVARFVTFILQEDVFTRVRTGRGVPYAVSGLASYTLIFLGFLIGLAAAGFELTRLTVIVGALGVGIGFGLQNVVNNFVSGLILLFERPIQVGDSVELPGVWGDMKRIGMRASVIHTFDGAEVIVPNGMLVSEMVTNWTLSDRRRRIEVNVGVRYGTPAQRVIDLLNAVAKASPSVLAHPEPCAYFVKFGDSSLEFMLRTWIETSALGFAARSELCVGIQEALDQAGIGVPFPQRDLHLVSVNPEAASNLGSAPSPSPHPGPAPGSTDE